MSLEIEIGPGLFVPPENDSYSVDFAIEVMNRAYPGCTGMYLDRAGHMLVLQGATARNLVEVCFCCFLLCLVLLLQLCQRFLLLWLCSNVL